MRWHSLHGRQPCDFCTYLLCLQVFLELAVQVKLLLHVVASLSLLSHNKPALNMQESVRVTHNRDIVPSVPPQYVGFHHVAREVWQLDGEKLFGTKVYLPWVCDGSGEDPVCHNSVCFMGLCTSVSDHMQYMGAPMYHRNSNPC